MEIVDDFQIESIEDHKDTGAGRLYLCKWVGFSDADNTWEPAGNVDESDVRAYEEGLEELERVDQQFAERDHRREEARLFGEESQEEDDPDRITTFY